jgi:poly(3-hydroxybutyrate) depolymerase
MNRALILAALLAAPTPSAARAPSDVPPALATAGVQRFMFSGWAGPAIPVWYLRPASAGPDAPVLFVMHGVRRDADRYVGEWVELAAAHGVVVVVPEYSDAAFPRALNYNHGRMFDAAGAPRPRGDWSWSAIEPVFDAVVARERLGARDYALYGHSAGAQFVHRHVLTGGGPRMRLAIVANAGSYAMPTPDAPWPFGAGGLPPGAFDAATAFRRPLALLLGTADNDPKHPSLPDQPEAQAQGPHRLARGQNFYAFSRRAAGPALAWTCALAPDVGHDNGRMAPFALALVLGRAAPRPGADCAAIAPVAAAR